MTAISRAASIDDLRSLARRRLPRFAFDYIDGGAEGEHNLAENQRAFQSIRLTPRYLNDISQIVTETELFGTTYAVPFGVAPVGALNMAWPDADVMMAGLAARKKMPFVISTASSTAIEKIAAAADGYSWFQIYVSRDEALADQLLRRARAAGCEVLVVTVDVASPGKRDRDIRNELQVPFKLTPRLLADLVLHPRWSLETLRHGAPGFANFTGDQAGDMGSRPLAEIQKQIISNQFTWDDLHRMRDKWKGPMLLKGILHVEDAVLGVDAGCDGIIVSNHGGRQLDAGPASIHALPEIAKAVADKVPVLLDSGIRRGADIVRSKALGANFVLAGRPFAYGAAAGGQPGCARAYEILETELKGTLGQLGTPRYGDVDLRVCASVEAGSKPRAPAVK